MDPHSLENLSILENLAITWPYTDHPTFRRSAPQAYQCLISHFLASLGACSLILYIHVAIHVVINWQLSWSSESADQYRLTMSRAQVSTHWVPVFFEINRWKCATFRMIAGSSSIFWKCIWNKLCSWAALLKFWFQTDLGRENSASYCTQGNGVEFIVPPTEWLEGLWINLIN